MRNAGVSGSGAARSIRARTARSGARPRSKPRRGGRRRSGLAAIAALGLCAALLGGCTNEPYAEKEANQKIYYSSFNESPKTLDPAIAYTTAEHVVLGNVYEGLVQYDYLKRPYELIPALAESLPEVSTGADGHVHYRFRIRADARYHSDPCFSAFGSADTRTVVAQDFAFELARTADPALASPVAPSFEKIEGYPEFGEKLKARRESDIAFAKLPVHEQYAQLGGIPGVRVLGERDLELVLTEAYPQILYWMVMPFVAAVPWEAVAYYDGQSRPSFRDHPVGAGPYQMVLYDKQHKMVLRRHPGWYGVLHPEWKAPGTVYPGEGEPSDVANGFLDPARIGQPLPRIEEIAFYREKEPIPYFGKFIQGYYDAFGNIIKESFDSIVKGGRLSPDMEARGLHLEKSVEPAVYYIGFNMLDPVLGSKAGDRGRKLRQAMSLVIDSKEFLRLFQNGRGVPAQSQLPPGLFGFREEYQNPYRQVDLEKARKLLAEAGYAGGIDPATGQPLQLGFDGGSTDIQVLLTNQFFVNAWRQLGIDVVIRATNYNQFQEKMRKGAQQIFNWGWVADYPDPENFLFLLESSNSRVKVGGPNDTNFSDPRYDKLFAQMKARPNDAERQRIIDEMLALLREERPWIELYHREEYALYQPWLAPVKPFGMSFPMVKYFDIDPKQREELRAKWNDPVEWPAYALAGITAIVLIPGVVTYMRERQ